MKEKLEKLREFMYWIFSLEPNLIPSHSFLVETNQLQYSKKLEEKLYIFDADMHHGKPECFIDLVCEFPFIIHSRKKTSA